MAATETEYAPEACQTPPLVYAPLPTELVSVNVSVVTAEITNVPFAAVLPPTPEIVTLAPTVRPCPAEVTTIGVAFDAAVVAKPRTARPEIR